MYETQQPKFQLFDKVICRTEFDTGLIMHNDTDELVWYPPNSTPNQQFRHWLFDAKTIWEKPEDVNWHKLNVHALSALLKIFQEVSMTGDISPIETAAMDIVEWVNEHPDVDDCVMHLSLIRTILGPIPELLYILNPAINTLIKTLEARGLTEEEINADLIGLI